MASFGATSFQNLSIKEDASAPRIDVGAAHAHLDAIDAALEHTAPLVDADGDASWGPVVVAPHISLAEAVIVGQELLHRWVFEPFIENPTVGRLLASSKHTFVHDHSRRVAMTTIDYQLRDMTRFQLDDVQLATGRRLCRVQQATDSLTPLGLVVGGDVLDAGDGQPYPTFVLEIFYKNESLSDLRATLARWMDGTSVQVAFGIKVNTRGHRYVLVLHVRGQPVVESRIDHHATPIRWAGFPVAALYWGVALPPALAGYAEAMVNVDIYLLRESLYGPNSAATGAGFGYIGFS
ncbi:hypothetical protein SDRG_11606 [Saprolegnia diclina VS20]|uniref:Restriction endonuclease domain-containing protein n=1 Tax=Saprolegnia diclina (strain VS20) TaxID=1156394 RepID=T0Q7G8_SAPDV|nr:hypothetical protein SDRG_11606 [Saprolegnia diclina VS20]EQC30546.1 hypothetical protein SDRG_11606 [Saprolegnia diclina VS20]|eukprot:XP_008615872.1 hypothetical protein SDRG_11606 [Saprolegnia diclina VS20]